MPKFSNVEFDLTWMKFHYRPQRSCGQGNIFTAVCHSVHMGGSPLGRTPPPDQADPPPTRQTPPDQADPPSGAHTPPPSDQADTPLGPGRPPPDQADPPGSRLQHTVNEGPVRILLECILVSYKIIFFILHEKNSQIFP